MVTGFWSLVIFKKICLLDVWQGTEYVSAIIYNITP